MNFFWVNHGQTYEQEIDGGYIWSPTHKKIKGKMVSHWSYDYMKTVEPGDIVFSFVKTYIQAIGYAVTAYQDCDRPIEYPAESDWNSKGWKVKVEFVRLKTPFRPKDYFGEIQQLLPQNHTPLDKNGGGCQGCYLTLIGKDLGLYLLNNNNIEIPSVNMDSSDDITVKRTEKSAITLQRLGQPYFRKKLIEKYSGKCQVTGIKLNELLRASHIKPWSLSNDQERLDCNNGLLLASHIDVLFDKGFISFDDGGSMLYSNSQISELFMSQNIPSREIIVDDKTRNYLAWHRENIFKATKKH